MDQAKPGQPRSPPGALHALQRAVAGQGRERATWSWSPACGLHPDGNNVVGRGWFSLFLNRPLLQNKVGNMVSILSNLHTL